MRLPFGKYTGKQINYIKVKDPDYYDWLVNNIKDFEERFNKKRKNIILKNSPVVNNENWNNDFKWHESYSEDINENILKWYKTPWYKIKLNNKN